LLEFIAKLDIDASHQILDLGSEGGSYLAKYYPYPENITLADISSSEPAMSDGVARRGLAGYRVIPTSGSLPIDDGEFDAVWCNSVIEHVTIERELLDSVSDADFRRQSAEHQMFFASEVERIAKGYFVQTPYIHFPIESHSILPLIPYLSHPTRYKLSQALKSYWIKQWTADFLLYDLLRFENDFRSADQIVFERAWGLKKSLIAYRSIR
jgi:2-polyprenyl-3-methyl-5-hydroxy-6-metoxy-1,4-benzoquinol methylase